MGYYDELPGENIAPAGSFASDPDKQEEEIDQLLQQKKTEEAPVEEAPAAEAPAAEAPTEEASPEQNFFQQATDYAAEALGLRDQEESQELRKEGLAKNDETIENLEEGGPKGNIPLPQVTTPELNIGGKTIIPELTSPGSIPVNPAKLLAETTRAVVGGCCYQIAACHAARRVVQFVCKSTKLSPPKSK